MSIVNIQHNGVLVGECRQERERRVNQTVPAHPNGIPVSRKRWLLVYATRRFRGNDDDCSIVYQLRADHPDGELIREGMLARSTEDWRPHGTPEGVSYKKEHRSPAAFGLPKGACIGGREPPHSNVFAIRWGTVARSYQQGIDYVEGTAPDPDMVRNTQSVEWIQVKLNEAEDDIVPIVPVQPLRQLGYESGPMFCSIPDVQCHNSGRKQAVPYSDDCGEWVECMHFDDGRSAAIKYRYSPEAGRYEWVETGPIIVTREGLSEAGQLVRIPGGWVAGGVTTGIEGHVWRGRGLIWLRLEDPFSSNHNSEPILASEPATRSPANFYYCADGVLRCFAGEGSSSPYGNERDPLYCWDIDPDDGFRAGNRRMIYDSVRAGLSIRPEARPKIDMCKLLPFQGTRQYLVHRVSVTSMQQEHAHTQPNFWIFPPINEAEKECCAIYYATISYDEVEPLPWSYSGDSIDRPRH